MIGAFPEMPCAADLSGVSSPRAAPAWPEQRLILPPAPLLVRVGVLATVGAPPSPPPLSPPILLSPPQPPPQLPLVAVAVAEVAFSLPSMKARDVGPTELCTITCW